MGNLQPTRNKSCLQFIISKLIKNKFTRLIAAVKAGNLNLIKYMHDKHVNFNQYLPNGDTPLHVAAKYNRLGVIKFLTDNVPQLNINDKNFVGDTPLMIAVMANHVKIVEYLVVKKYADVNIAENKGFTPFIAACANGNVEMVKFLVQNGSNYRVKAKDGQTGLHRAAFYGNLQVIQYLVKELKLNMMIPDKKGNLPIHLACMKLNFSCIRLLIRASPLPTSEVLHIENKFHVKPIDILVKVLNRLRNFDEPKDFEPEQIEEYIKDKRNVPFFRKEASPRSRIKSLTNFPKFFRKATFTLRDPPAGDNGPVRPDTISNDSIINLKPIDLTEVNSPTDKKAKETEEEEIFKFGRITSETIFDPFPQLPLTPIRGPSLGNTDTSASHIVPFEKRMSRAKTLKFEKSPLKVETKMNRSFLVKKDSFDKLSVSSFEDQKSNIYHFTPRLKSKFALQNSSQKVMES